MRQHYESGVTIYKSNSSPLKWLNVLLNEELDSLKLTGKRPCIMLSEMHILR